ncbi:MAG: hypothetical protein U0350_07655 [Caldilineaceae bacterium]
MQNNGIKLKLHQPAHYCIGVQGILDAGWSDTFAGLTITCDASTDLRPVTILTGQVLDQAMLLGVLNGLYSLGLCLLWVECLDNEGANNKGRLVGAAEMEKTKLVTTN